MSRNVLARTLLTLAFASAFVGKPATAEAQNKASITPFFTAFFAPLPYAKDLDQGGGVTADERLSNAPGVGLRIGFPIGGSLGIEAQGAYIWTGRQTKITSGGVPFGLSLGGNAIMASGRLTLHPRRSNFRGIVGVGYQKLGGDAWDPNNFGGADFNDSSVGGILGFGVRASITPSLGIDITLESFLHSSDPVKSGSKQFQADMNLTVGVPIGL